METMMALLVGLMIAAALYLMLTGVLVRFVFGFILMGNAVNLLIFTAGRLTYSDPPLIHPGQTNLIGQAANALPQALILTAIVIGFAMTTFLLILLVRTFDLTRTLDADQPSFRCELPDTGLMDGKTGIPEKEA